MKLTNFARLSAVAVLAATMSVSALPLEARAGRGVDPALVPNFGVEPGQDSDCPPNRAAFIDALNADVAANRVDFPTDSSPESQLARINAAITTLQNMDGGCPVDSTTFEEQANDLEAEVSGAGIVARSPRLPTNRLPPVFRPNKPAKPAKPAPTKKPSKVPAKTKPALPVKPAKAPAAKGPAPPLKNAKFPGPKPAGPPAKPAKTTKALKPTKAASPPKKGAKGKGKKSREYDEDVVEEVEEEETEEN
ncbi:hypothetical protein C8Q77DRAFT_1156039 [Trametes polyzona]|nr:hypothetical protein C8Q77DRAFT_1156039 [Trametes polyzona]